MHYKNAFIDYVEQRDYKIVEGTLTENNSGVSAVIEAPNNTPHKHFTQTIVHDRQDRYLYTVRLSYKDFENRAITDGIIETDCDHADARICQALGHATGPDNEPS